MDTFDRRNEIIRHLQQQQRASTRALSELLQVSEVISDGIEEFDHP